MVKKLLIILSVGIIGILVFFVLNYNYMNKEVFFSYKDEEKVVTEIPEENIKLYAKNKDSGMYTEFILQLGNRQRYFNWQNVSNPTYNPMLILSDINKDGVEELIVILTNGTGTGVHTEEVHIIDIVTFQDYDAENPIHFIHKNVKTRLSPEEIEISINDYVTIIHKEHINLEPQQFFDNIVFKDFIYYEIKDNKLYSLVKAKAGPASFIGQIEMSYYFQGKMYVVDNIKFKPIQLRKWNNSKI